MVVSFFITGSIKVGMAIGGFEVFTKMVLYYFHERLWFRYVSLGRSTSATSDSPLATRNQKLETTNLQTASSNSPLATGSDSSQNTSETQSTNSNQKLETRNQKPLAISQQPAASSQKPLSAEPATNIVQQSYTISLNDRIQQNNHSPKVFWMTGLSGSGKSTIANALQNELFQKGYQVYVLDGDNVRGGLNKDLDFSDEGRIENIRRISEVAKLFADAGFVVITAFISPFQSDREQAKNIIGSEYFCEVFVDTPLEICEQRDVKGLYKKARAGEIPNFTGIGSAFERPEDADILIQSVDMTVQESVRKLMDELN